MADEAAENGSGAEAEAQPKAPAAKPAQKQQAKPTEPSADDDAAEIVRKMRAEGVDLGDEPEEAQADKGEKVTTKAEDEEPAEEAKADEPAKAEAEEKEKQSTYQKNKRRLEEARRERDEARRLADKTASELAELRAEVDHWRRQVDAERMGRDRTIAEARQGRVPSAEEREIVELQRQLEEFQAGQRIARERALAQQKAQFERVRDAERDRLRQELDAVEHLGVSREEVLREFILSAEVGREESIETIAKRQAEVLAYRRARASEDAARNQAARSGSAPPPSRGHQPRAVAGPSADDDAAKIAAYLQAQGLV